VAVAFGGGARRRHGGKTCARRRNPMQWQWRRLVLLHVRMHACVEALTSVCRAEAVPLGASGWGAGWWRRRERLCARVLQLLACAVGVECGGCPGCECAPCLCVLGRQSCREARARVCVWQRGRECVCVLCVCCVRGLCETGPHGSSSASPLKPAVCGKRRVSSGQCMRGVQLPSWLSASLLLVWWPQRVCAGW
jgi:hypothetical protein